MAERHVVIVGGGFGGLAVARGLRKAAVRVTVLDRTNHHLFQPLLYQVATAMLAPAEIATPIRHALGNQQNATVLLAELTGVDAANHRVQVKLPDGSTESLAYDKLVLATGATHSYFGHDEFADHAPGLKTLADATAIRERILTAFEEAETLGAPEEREPLLTFVLVGGGPTGVEMAGASAELRRYSLKAEFRRIDPRAARIILIEASPRILGPFPESLAAKARLRLERLGVEVCTGAPVEKVDAEGVVVAGRRIRSRTVIWTAGVAASPVGTWLGIETDKSGRVKVGADGRVPGHPDIFVLGDAAHWLHEGKPLPGVAPVAMQQGDYIARVIAADALGRPAPAFRYRDRGNLAVVGRNYAIYHRGWLKLGGYLAWLLWVFVHIANLAAFMNRLRTMTQWAWSYFTRQRGSRLILEPVTTKLPDGFRTHKPNTTS
jgi:NADH:ubiquinone reductase (H+-translocating)